MAIEHPADIHPVVERLFNSADVDGLTDLYEDEAVIVGPEGERGQGLDAIRANWQALVDMGARAMTIATVYCVEQGDLALLRNDYTLDVGGMPITGSTAEVVRRQADGTWRYVIDNPFGANPTA
jgi:ketosteroid isomerase-like protein